MLPSKQLTEFIERILSKCQCGFILVKAMVRNIVYKLCLKLEKTNNKNNAFGALLTNLSKAFACWSNDLLIANFRANGLDLLSHA